MEHISHPLPPVAMGLHFIYLMSFCYTDILTESRVLAQQF